MRKKEDFFRCTILALIRRLHHGVKLSVFVDDCLHKVNRMRARVDGGWIQEILVVKDNAPVGVEWVCKVHNCLHGALPLLLCHNVPPPVRVRPVQRPSTRLVVGHHETDDVDPVPCLPHLLRLVDQLLEVGPRRRQQDVLSLLHRRCQNPLLQDAGVAEQDVQGILVPRGHVTLQHLHPTHVLLAELVSVNLNVVVQNDLQHLLSPPAHRRLPSRCRPDEEQRPGLHPLLVADGRVQVDGLLDLRHLVVVEVPVHLASHLGRHGVLPDPPRQAHLRLEVPVDVLARVVHARVQPLDVLRHADQRVVGLHVLR
eukprot:Rhum_TRINITY_DN14709_c4_g1::Rhum_TRINITY_DN14709_c4_g1_i1::g.110742::m.110742